MESLNDRGVNNTCQETVIGERSDPNDNEPETHHDKDHISLKITKFNFFNLTD